MRAVQNTRKITRTMELVATSKLKRAQDRVMAARPYAEALREVIGSLLTPDLRERFPLLRQPPPLDQGGPRRVALVLVTSNRGLCGAFNGNLIKEARRRIEELEAAGYTVDLSCVGKKGAGFFKYVGRKLAMDRQDIGDRPTAEQAGSIVEGLIREYEAGRLASVEMIHATFRSVMSAPPTVTRVLPVPALQGKAAPTDYILRPGAAAIVERLLPAYVRNSVYRGLVETVAGFYGAQRTAMKSATDNAGEILEYLKRTYNRNRQAQITQEIAEIVGGAAALQG
jgi:F-type H+-transporting ATPase subunit gamma